MSVLVSQSVPPIPAATVPPPPPSFPLHLECPGFLLLLALPPVLGCPPLPRTPEGRLRAVSLWPPNQASEERGNQARSTPGTQIPTVTGVNSLGPGCDFLKCNFQFCFIDECPHSLWCPQDLTDDKSTLVQAMAWCHQAPSHYLSQCWPRSMLPYDITRPHVVKYILLHC